MALTIRRVTALPDPLVANTIYLLDDGAGGLQITTVGTNIAAPKTSTTAGSVSSAITTALTGYYTSEETDDAIAAALASLDTSNSAEYAADITARDLLEPTKNIFVLVADASADPDVDAGAALYFYNFAAGTWIRVAEYESMDIDLAAAIATAFPNKAVLDALSDEAGQLYYNGAPIGGVLEGANDW